MKESPIQHLILDYLAAEHILAFRMNTGALPAGGDDGTKRRWVRFGVKGMADILAFPHGSVLWIETKSTTGRLSGLQESFARQVREAGHIYQPARALEPVIEAICLARVGEYIR